MSSQKRKDLIHPQRKQAISVGTEHKCGFAFSLCPSLFLSLSLTSCPPNLSENPYPVYCCVIESVLHHHRSDLTGHYVEKRATQRAI